MESTLKLRKTLRLCGYSATTARLQIFEALVLAHRPISVVELANKVAPIDKVSVYRTVALFETIGVIHKVWTGFKSKVELSEMFSTHHHHFNCILCGYTQSVMSPALEKSLHGLEVEHGFELRQHSVELSGLCKNCRSSSPLQ